LHAITTPFNVDAWRACLKLYPDPAYANCIISDISNRFRVGFVYNEHTMSTAAHLQHPTTHWPMNMNTLQL